MSNVARDSELCDDVELAIARTQRLSRQDQERLLLLYGVMTGRDSLSSTSGIRAQIGSAGQPDEVELYHEIWLGGSYP